MKIVIAGIGETGRFLAENLLKQGHDLVIIEIRSDAVKQAQEHLDAQIIAGDAASALVLEPVVDESTDLFVALTDRDETNVVATMIARRFGAKHAVSRMNDPANLIHPLLTDDPEVSMLNADMIVSRDLTRLVGNPTADEIEFFANGKAEMIKLHANENSLATTQPLKNLTIPDSWLFIGAVREGVFQIASGDFTLKADDQVLAVGNPTKHKELENLLGLHVEKVRRVILVGMNPISVKLANTLKKRGIEIRLIEESVDSADRAAAELTGVLVFKGNGTSEDILDQAGAEQADYLIALTSDDENNVLICLLAKEKGVKRVVALTQKAQYQRIVEKIGIDSVVSPRSAMVDEIIRCIHRGSLAGFSILAGGSGRMMEFTVHRGCKVVDVPLAKLKLPDQSLIGAIVRGDEVIIPRGKDRIKVGDHIVVFSTLTDFSPVERLFTNNR
jgi:trk system potassium uptake protein